MSSRAQGRQSAVAPASALAVALCLIAAGCGTKSRHVAVAPPPPAPMPAYVPTGCVASGPLYTEGAKPRGRRKLVALTFDDGPTPYTHQILDILERSHVHATFFVIGNQVFDEPAQVRRALLDGDLIANHTYTHPDMVRLDPPAVFDELYRTQQTIWQDTGFTPCLWRAPYGSIDTRLEYLARGLGMISIQWDTDPQDFTVPPADTIYKRVMFGNPRDPDPGVHPGAIVLMHDGGGNRSHTVQALPRVIAALRARGYRFVTVAKLLHLRMLYGRR